MEQNENRFVAYEYKEISVSSDVAALYMDAYENFGWEIDDKVHSDSSLGKVKLHFRRDRKILNKTELTRLQRNFDGCMNEICELESSKKTSAAGVSISVGLVGTAFVAGSVFAITAAVPNIPLCIILAVPGFIGWLLPYFIFKKMVADRTRKITPLIEAKYDELYEICEKGSKLLH